MLLRRTTLPPGLSAAGAPRAWWTGFGGGGETWAGTSPREWGQSADWLRSGRDPGLDESGRERAGRRAGVRSWRERGGWRKAHLDVVVLGLRERLALKTAGIRDWTGQVEVRGRLSSAAWRKRPPGTHLQSESWVYQSLQ